MSGLSLAGLACALVLCALPSTAFAQTPDDPDSYLFRYHINDPGEPLPNENGLGPFDSFTNGAGVQTDLFDPPFSGGLPENIECTLGQNSQFYGATEWWRFHPHRNGQVGISVVGDGFRPVVAIMPIDANSDPVYDELACLDANASTGAVSFVYPLLVRGGGTYAIQVGGANSPNTSNGTPGEGDYTLQLFYDPDTDGDGVLDSGDRCRTQPGSANHRGCPDTDRDGIADPDDRCVTQAGTPQHRGCPDSDGDNIADPDDRCPTQQGAAQLQGCRDTDGDGRPDIDDQCDNEDASARDKDKDGCLDTLLLHRTVNATINVGGIPGGVVVRSFLVKGVPAGARVIVVCRMPDHSRCGGLRVRHASSAGVRAHAARRFRVRLRPKRLPYGSRITVRVTAFKATGKYIRLTVVRGGSRIARVDRCMNRGSTRLRKKGCR